MINKSTRNVNGSLVPGNFYKRVGLVLFLGGCLSLIVAVNSAMAESKLAKTLTVTGNGMKTIETTIAEVQLGVEIQGKTATEVQKEIAQRTSAVVDILRSKDVQKLKTTGVQLNPNYNYDQANQNNGQPVLIGYIGTNTVSFCISTDQVGTLLDETVKAGASRIDGISFRATPEAIFTAKKEALRKASINAQDQADVVLETLNLTSKEIVKIEVDEARVEEPQYAARDQLSASEAKMSTPVVGGEQTVEASVTLQITY
ncbi:MAG: hypothetical protein RLZZ04_2340 [Cyanobacteriota bacterium]|jgi:uncharacterized protein YggE